MMLAELMKRCSKNSRRIIRRNLNKSMDLWDYRNMEAWNHTTPMGGMEIIAHRFYFKSWQRFLAAFILLWFFLPHLFAQNIWIVQKEKDGIRLSSRKSATSSFNDVRVELDVPGNLSQRAAILENIPKYTEWAYATKKSVLIKQLGPGKIIYYSEVEVPWPATNRFYYARFELKIDSLNHTMQLLSANIPDYKPMPADLEPVPYSRGTWNVKTISPKTIHIDYVLELNPGGSLPAW